jgi:hypothetical protein
MDKAKQQLSRFITERTFVIWGITELQHTHGYIHANFFRVLKRNEVSVLWLEDHERNLAKIPKGSIVLFVDIAARELKFSMENYYIGHNSQKMLEFQSFILQHPGKALNWSFTTNAAIGLSDAAGSIAKFDDVNTRLFQPYGTPLPNRSFVQQIETNTDRNRIENLIGSVWNDGRNQGNAEIINNFALALKSRNMKIRRIELGKLAKFRFSEKIEKKLVLNSAIGASIHSNYQISDGYLACRLFKSVSYGRVPVTNQNAFNGIFKEGFVYSQDVDEMIDSYLSLSPVAKRDMTFQAQRSLKQYTYEAGLNRLVRALRREW